MESSETPPEPTGEQLQALEQRRNAALQHIRQYPDPVLRSHTLPVKEFDESLKAMVERMWHIQRDAFGVGLAAPQVGLRLQIFTYQIGENNEPGVMINPEITAFGEETEVGEEGCLSIGGGDIRVPVERSLEVTIKAQDLSGEEVTMDVADFTARVFQHEIDHLKGELMLDKIADDEARKAVMAMLRPR